MSPIGPAIAVLAQKIARHSMQWGRPVAIDTRAVGSRRGMLALKWPGLWSPNRACRLVRAADGWIVVNLARDEDIELLPAWIGCEAGDAPWRAIISAARQQPWRSLVAMARLLGMPVAGVGEIANGQLDVPRLPMASGKPRAPGTPLRVIDLSSLWAGPLCGAVLAQMGVAVTKIESASRPDPSRVATPALFQRLNGQKTLTRLEFKDKDARARLFEEIAAADVVITSARPRAFDQLGLAPQAIFAANPGLVWVAITGYGWTGEGADRVAFGDDAAAAGGLVGWSRSGAPRFLGDALADPLTGLAAAAGALEALGHGGGVLVDAAMARCACAAAALCKTRKVV